MRDAVLSIPLTTRFRGITVRETMLVQGPAGWGEFAPFVEYDVDEARAWWAAAHEAATTGWPSPVRDTVPVNAIVPAVDAEAATRLVTAAACTTVKVKVAEAGQDEPADLARLEAVRGALGSAGRVRIDANAAWDLDTALDRLPRYDRAAGGLEYAEQPCAHVGELAALRRRLDIPIAADESIRRSGDPERVVAAGAADIAVLKVAPLGGVCACLELAERLDLPVVVSSGLETSVGLAAGVALAAALPALPFACGLGSGLLLSDDVTDDPLVPHAGHLAVRDVVVSTAKLDRLAAAPERAQWWRTRRDAVAAA